MTESDTIPVLVVEPQKQLPGRRMVPGVGPAAARVVDVPVSALRESVHKVTKQLGELAQSVQAHEGVVTLDQIAVDLSVSANGSVQWIAGVGGAVGSTVTLTYKVTSGEVEVES